MAANKLSISKANDSTWTYRASASEDKATATLRYRDDFIGWASRCPKFKSEHPDLPAFTLVEISASRVDGDLIDVDLTYEATALGTEYPGRDASDETPARYSVQIAGREEHVLTNSFAAGLSETELKALYAISNGTEAAEDGTPYEDDVTSTNGLALLAKIRKGNTHYKTGGITYIERKVVNTLSALNTATIGKRDNPPGGVAGGAAKWLYVGATAEPQDTGETWSLERQWEFTPAEWDNDLYGTV